MFFVCLLQLCGSMTNGGLTLAEGDSQDMPRAESNAREEEHWEATHLASAQATVLRSCCQL